ncbi:MAG: NAD(P)H-dependent oxidoreductase [Bacteroidota bacterium]
MATVLIVGSARKDGDTSNLVVKTKKLTNWDVIDLNDYQIGYFDYSHSNKNDDYLGLMHNIITTYDTLIFVTPIYWYSMSGIMKVFFDRITDLLTIEKELGRKLRGKKMAVMTISTGGNLGNAFWLPFSETANYLGMQYLGNLHTLNKKDYEKDLKEFIKEINS